MIPRIFHRTAPGPHLTWEEHRLGRKARDHHPDWRFELWDDADNRRMFAQVFPDLVARYDRIPRGVVKADIARCVYMHLYGGVYLDTDYRLFRPLDDDTLAAECILPIEIGSFADGEDMRIGNSIFASAAGHPFWRDWIRYVFANNYPDEEGRKGVVSIAGPRAITRYVLEDRDRGAGIRFPEPEAFHPEQLGLGVRAAARMPECYGIHLCWGSWRDKPLVQRARNQARRKLSAV